MCTSTLLVVDGVAAQPLITMVLSTVELSAIGTSVPLLPEQPGNPFTVTFSVVVRATEGRCPPP